MSVNEVARGLRVLTVYDDSPAQRGGIRKGDLIVSVGGKSLAGRTSQEATTQIKGPAGTEVTLGVVSGDKPARDVTLERARVDVPAVEAEMRKLGDRKIAHVRLAGFTSGAHGQVREAVDKLLDEGAEGVVLDLRDNGGGLLNEAVLTSSIFVGDGTIVSTKGLHRPRRVFEAEGTPIDRDDPGRRARQRELGVGVGDRHRRAAGPRPRRGGRRDHVRQGRLPGDPPPLQRRRARHHGRRVLHAGRAQPRRQGRRARREGGRRPRRRSATRGSRRRSRSSRRPRARERARAAPRPSSRCSSAVAASSPPSPFFTRGRRINVDKGGRASVGDLVLVAPDRPARRAREDRPPARAARRGARRPRGADARPRAAAPLRPARGARGARGRRADRARPGPPRPARPADVHDRPADGARLRRRDQRGAARLGPDPRVGAHRRRRRVRASRAPRSTARPTAAARASTSPARSSRCCRRRSPTRRAR